MWTFIFPNGESLSVTTVDWNLFLSILEIITNEVIRALRKTTTELETTYLVLSE